MSFKNFLLITIIGALLFIPFLGGAHLFDWDEINFAESAREMLLSGNFSRVQINFQPFWEKPPLFIWAQALSMSALGINEFAARLPNAIIGIITLLSIFYIGSRQKDSRLGWLWVLIYIGTFLPHFYFKSGIIDPLFNLLIFLGITRLIRLSDIENLKDGKRKRISAGAGILIGLAILTKGPVAMLVVMVTAFLYWATRRFKPFMSFAEVLIFLVTAGLVSSVWFGLETIKNGPWFIVTFIQYQIRLLTTPDAGHGGPFYNHFVVLLIGCFPATVFLWNAFRNQVSETFENRNFKQWMILLLVTVLVIFSIVKTKIVHYSSLTYFPITYLAAYYLYNLLFMPDHKPRFLNYVLLLALGLGISAALILTPYIAMHTELIRPYLQDPFGQAALQARVYWSGWESLVGIFYLLQIIISFLFLRKKKSRYIGVMNLFVSTIICIQLTVYVFVNRIESYSQRAAISFFQAHSDGSSYADVLGYKSYAQLFYGQRRPSDVLNPRFEAWLQEEKKKHADDAAWPSAAEFDEAYKQWLLTGDTDKPVYFVTKVQRADEFLSQYPLKKIGEENGFVFLQKTR